MNVQGVYKGTHFTGNTLVLMGSGVLHTLNVNTKGAAASVVTIYDGVDNTGAVLAIIDSLNQVGCYTYDMTVVTGIYITATGTPDLTVTFARSPNN